MKSLNPREENGPIKLQIEINGEGHFGGQRTTLDGHVLTSNK